MKDVDPVTQLPTHSLSLDLMTRVKVSAFYTIVLTCFVSIHLFDVPNE